MKTELATTLKRETNRILTELADARDPVLITQHGLPAAYLVDVGTFEAIQQKLEVLEIIARGEKAVDEGRVVTHKAAEQRMARWLK
ncbi:type II toxin-antitoxin system Phd/YefM family antitoxin [Luteolibacter ambystomatis]|uniref:Antitoxin n=1 Tax=Luteolibacter ambystomatis TaxID=2824561 RepID=A0A975IYV2_9BACT|nr:type II toxin-antitoxin system Phd/YefM family antitoxin [Luteolibacter ambystomatis]QUE50612.1 type II toxin-antitoxin system Phd/YefM family antitoxin [Luteolibacter ambystomatis]